MAVVKVHGLDIERIEFFEKVSKAHTLNSEVRYGKHSTLGRHNRE